MHRYSVHAGHEDHVPVWLAFVSVAAAYALSKLLAAFAIVLPFWVEAPSVMGFYGVFYRMFDRYFWRTRLASLLGVVDVPNLAGSWQGKLTTSFDEYAKEVVVTAEIAQTWTRILVQLATANSKSRSEGATIICQSGSDVLLIYEYLSEPKPGVVATMHTHRGTARLALERAGAQDSLSGEYYTGRDRQNQGRLELTRATKV